jgi:hypothetical protein
MSKETTAIYDIEMQFTSAEVTALMRALALAQHTAAGASGNDDLQVLRQRIYLQACGVRRPKPVARIYSTAGRIRVWDDETGAAA